jgi:hypothetical protein
LRLTAGEKWDIFLLYARLTGMSIVVFALPLSNFFMSFGTFWIFGAWFLDIITDLVRKKSFKNRWAGFTKSTEGKLIVSLYLFTLAGLLWSSDFKHAFWDLRVKLPILAIPILLLTQKPLNKNEIKAVCGFYILGLIIAVTWCLFIYLHIIPLDYKDVREISVFISHIRFSLMLVLGICIAFYITWNQPYGKIFSILISFYFIAFLYVLESMTGFIVLGGVILNLLIFRIIHARKKSVQFVFLAIFILLPLACLFYLRSCYINYFTVEKTNWANLEEMTPWGEPYNHYPEFKLIENGHYANTYVAEQELKEGWRSRSSIDPDSTDGMGHIIKWTLLRYMASKGLRKDLDGIRALSDEDIRNVESGYTSFDEKNKNGIEKRIDKILFEYSTFRVGGNPNGHSVFQRLEFWKAGWAIAKTHPWSGVGTGDVKQAFNDQYSISQSRLDEKHRLRAHNQYLTIWVALGIVGLLLLLTMLIYPFIKWRTNLLYTSFLIIIGLSCLTEDTLESEAGVMFFAFFYIFLLLVSKQALQEPAAE